LRRSYRHSWRGLPHTCALRLKRCMPMMWELLNEPFDIRANGMLHAPEWPGLDFTMRADALDRFRYVDGPEFQF
jgi:L-alanine-DL-glutamate epimerase-like enolase superfamily enzyme